jgi:hypothetical protein
MVMDAVFAFLSHALVSIRAKLRFDATVRRRYSTGGVRLLG